MKIITTLITLCLTGSAYANDLQIVNPGSEEGAFRQVLTTIGNTIEHDFVQANNPVTAYSYIEESSLPVLTMWSSEWPGNPEITSPDINNDNIVGLMTYETMMCSREYSSLEEMQGQIIKIATWGSEPVAKFLNSLSNTTGIDFVVVPFGGSGSTTKGYIAGDADTVFTITTRQSAIEEDTATRCFAFSEDGDLGFRFVDAIIITNADQNLVEPLRAILSELSQTAEWKDKFSGTVTYPGNSKNVVSIFDQAVENFSK